MKIMVCYDYYGKPNALLSEALKFAKAFKADVYVVKVFSGSPQSTKISPEDSDKNISRIKSMFREEDLTVVLDEVPQLSSVGEAIVEYAKGNHMDIIIVGVFQKSKVGKLIFGSTAQYVILNSKCPVLSVS